MCCTSGHSWGTSSPTLSRHSSTSPTVHIALLVGWDVNHALHPRRRHAVDEVLCGSLSGHGQWSYGRTATLLGRWRRCICAIFEIRRAGQELLGRNNAITIEVLQLQFNVADDAHAAHLGERLKLRWHRSHLPAQAEEEQCDGVEITIGLQHCGNIPIIGEALIAHLACLGGRWLWATEGGGSSSCSCSSRCRAAEIDGRRLRRWLHATYLWPAAAGRSRWCWWNHCRWRGIAQDQTGAIAIETMRTLCQIVEETQGSTSCGCSGELLLKVVGGGKEMRLNDEATHIVPIARCAAVGRQWRRGCGGQRKPRRRCSCLQSGQWKCW